MGVKRAFEIIRLMNEPRTIKFIESKTGASSRSVYRYLKLFETQLGIPIDKTFHGQKYFLASDVCPCCGKEVKNGQAD